DREGDDDAPVQLGVVEGVGEREEEDQQGDEGAEEDDRHDVDHLREGRDVALRGTGEEPHMEQCELQDPDHEQQLEEALRTEVEPVFREPDLHEADEERDDPRDHARELEPVRTVRREPRFEDGDPGEGGEQEDREEGATDEAVLIADQDPYDADQSRGDEGADRDPQRAPDEQRHVLLVTLRLQPGGVRMGHGDPLVERRCLHPATRGPACSGFPRVRRRSGTDRDLGRKGQPAFFAEAAAKAATRACASGVSRAAPMDRASSLN
ncbi:unnamed protein product, partial [Penicillium discolor]